MAENSEHISDPSHKQETLVKPDVREEIDHSESLWARIKTDPVALCTFLLVVVTLLLAVIAFIQLVFLTRAQKTAEQEASTAKKSVEVAKEDLYTANRPWLTVSWEHYPLLTAFRNSAPTE
ncbi:MAG: hypothetical protein ACP5SH_09790 [Syntrophobacteraceae bacterium]